MPLDEKDIQEIKAIHKEVFNETITDKEAEEIGSRLVRLFQLLSEPLPSQRVKQVTHDQPANNN